MKKIFIITGEPSGDKLASTVISKLKQTNSEIEYCNLDLGQLTSTARFGANRNLDSGLIQKSRGLFSRKLTA